MRFKSFLLAFALPVALGACGQDGGEETVATDSNAMMESENVALGNDDGAVASSGAQDFVNKAAASDRFEIESSRLAEASATSPAVKEFAAMMIKAHTDSTAKLKSTLASNPSDVTINDALNAEQQAQLDGLKTKKGADFDTAYATAQVGGHEKTLAELRNYASNGDNEALKTFAQDLVPIVTDHLNQARKLK
jgi:putative membrane protein